MWISFLYEAFLKLKLFHNILVQFRISKIYLNWIPFCCFLWCFTTFRFTQTIKRNELLKLCTSTSYCAVITVKKSHFMSKRCFYGCTNHFPLFAKTVFLREVEWEWKYSQTHSVAMNSWGWIAQHKTFSAYCSVFISLETCFELLSRKVERKISRRETLWEEIRG